MTIFADHCVHRDVVNALIQTGIKIEIAAAKRLDKSTDEEIFNYILKNSLALLTFDKDFGNITRFDITNSCGVVIVYVEEMSREKIIDETVRFFQKIKQKQLSGKLFIIEPRRIRTWPR